MNVAVPLTKTSIMEEVYKITGYTGAKTGGEGSMDIISSTEDDLRLLEPYYTEATGSLSSLVAAYGAAGEAQLTLNLPPNWDESAKPSLADNAGKYIVNYICLKWFNLSKKEEVQFYRDAVESISSNITRLLARRKKPVR